jgi:hypothetical protein
MVRNLAIYAVLCVVPSALAGAAFASVRWYSGHRSRRRTEPAYPPIERIAADLRRLAGAVDSLPSGSTMVRRRGAKLAYDDALSLACRALRIPSMLTELPLGWEREVERLRAETRVAEAGLVIRGREPR